MARKQNVVQELSQATSSSSDFSTVPVFQANLQAPGHALSLLPLSRNIDSQMATVILGNGKAIKQAVTTHSSISSNMIKSSDDTTKWVVVTHGIKNHTERVSSIKRVSAASAVYILSKVSPNHATLKTVEPVNCTIPNAIADAHGIPNDTFLYYYYNVGLDFMGEFNLAATIALVAWRMVNHNEIFRTTAKVDYKEDLHQLVVYIKNKFDTEELSENNWSTLANMASPFLLYLKTIRVTNNGGRAALAQKMYPQFDAKICSVLRG